MKLVDFFKDMENGCKTMIRIPNDEEHRILGEYTDYIGKWDSDYMGWLKRLGENLEVDFTQKVDEYRGHRNILFIQCK